MSARFVSRSLFVLRMIGFVVVLAWIGLLFASFAQTSLLPMVNRTGLYIFVIMAFSLLVLRPLERHLEKKVRP